MISPETYYSNSDNHGGYQYITLKEIVNNFILSYTGDETIIGNVKRFNVLYHAKRGIQELNFDALRDVKVLELEINDNYELILPFDFVNYVRVSWLDEGGNFHPMSMNNSSAIAKAYLQDHEFNILFDDLGNPLEGDSIQSDRRLSRTTTTADNFSDTDQALHNYQRYDHDTTKNANGDFNLDMRRGVIQFNTGIGSRVIVLEYISDGLNGNDENVISIHKMASEAVYSYIKWMFMTNKINIQEYAVNRAKKEYYNARRIAKSRLSGVRLNELVILLNGKGKWIKN